MELMIRSTAGRYRAANKAEVLTVAGQYLAADLSQPMRLPLDSAPATIAMLRQTFGPRDAEVFAMLSLDSRHRLIAMDELFYGTIDGASVHPRVVVKRALELNAAAVIFAHNHPSGISTQSAADEIITARLSDALGLVDIRVLDHIIVTSAKVTSFANLGLI